eukprot:12975886-Alexandrium_andersonii.AAC.1
MCWRPRGRARRVEGSPFQNKCVQKPQDRASIREAFVQQVGGAGAQGHGADARLWPWLTSRQNRGGQPHSRGRHQRCGRFAPAALRARTQSPVRAGRFAPAALRGRAQSPARTW